MEAAEAEGMEGEEREGLPPLPPKAAIPPDKLDSTALALSELAGRQRVIRASPLPPLALTLLNDCPGVPPMPTPGR